jgi:hypothetical protein
LGLAVGAAGGGGGGGEEGVDLDGVGEALAMGEGEGFVAAVPEVGWVDAAFGGQDRGTHVIEDVVEGCEAGASEWSEAVRTLSR